MDVRQSTRRPSGRLTGTAFTGYIGIVVAVLAIAAVALLLLRGGDGYEVTAEFENASQLVGGEEVTIAGTGVGTVNEIDLGPNGEALVRFSIDRDFAPLRRGTTATVRAFSLSGIANRQVELRIPPEGAGGEEIPDGGRLDQSETVSQVDLDQIFNTLDEDTVASLQKVIRGFSRSYDGVAEQANRGFRYLNPFLSTSRRLFRELARDEPALRRLVVEGAALTGVLAEHRDDISELVGNVDAALGATARERGNLARAIGELPGFMRSFNTTGVNLRAALDDLDPLVAGSRPAARALAPFLAELRAASRDLVPAVGDLDTLITRPGRANDLVGLTRLQNPLARIAVGPVRRSGAERQGAFPASARALADSLGTLEFFRPYAPELVGWFDHFGHSGILDANGGIGRAGLTLNTFSLSPGTGVPIVDIVGGPPFGAQDPETAFGLLDVGNLRRCPGANERPAPDGSNPFTDDGALDCDPTQIPPGR